MKKTFSLLLFLFISCALYAQTNPVMTAAFADSLKAKIIAVLPTEKYSITLSYESTVSAEGVLLKPLITRQVSLDDVDNNDFVQKMRLMIKLSPSWKPAMNAANTAVNGVALFYVDIKKGVITILDQTK
jgi:gamma-glutamylcysteine synthetase